MAISLIVARLRRFNLYQPPTPGLLPALAPQASPTRFPEPDVGLPLSPGRPPPAITMDATQTKILSTATLLTTPFDGGPEAVINHFGRAYPDLALPHPKFIPAASDHRLGSVIGGSLMPRISPQSWQFVEPCSLPPPAITSLPVKLPNLLPVSLLVTLPGP